MALTKEEVERYRLRSQDLGLKVVPPRFSPAKVIEHLRGLRQNHRLTHIPVTPDSFYNDEHKNTVRDGIVESLELLGAGHVHLRRLEEIALYDTEFGRTNAGVAIGTVWGDIYFAPGLEGKNLTRGQDPGLAAISWLEDDLKAKLGAKGLNDKSIYSLNAISEQQQRAEREASIKSAKEAERIRNLLGLEKGMVRVPPISAIVICCEQNYDPSGQFREKLAARSQNAPVIFLNFEGDVRALSSTNLLHSGISFAK